MIVILITCSIYCISLSNTNKESLISNTLICIFGLIFLDILHRKEQESLVKKHYSQSDSKTSDRHQHAILKSLPITDQLMITITYSNKIKNGEII